MWNYTIRADGALGTKIVVGSDDNDQEIYPIPMQHAIDFAIASLNSTIDQAALPQTVNEYTYTSLSQKQRNDQIRVRYMNGIIQILGVAFFIGISVVTYQLVGLVASERELGMSQLIECMMPNQRRWQPQMARMISYHLAFDIIYLPGWVVIAIIFGLGVFSKTSLGILIVFHILSGLALCSFSLFGAAFFKKAQLSGITIIIINELLAVLAQVLGKSSTGAVAVLSLLFPSMNYTFFTILMAHWEQENMATNLVKAAPNYPSKLPGIVLWVFLIVQIIVYPILASVVETTLWGTASKGRQINSDEGSQAAVELSGFTKIYKPNWFQRNIGARFGKKKDTVVAVNGLNLTVLRSQIVVLLGANGSGKSTTLEAIAGLSTVTSGTIAVDGSHGIGLCPQKNVVWGDLTVQEHVSIFNRLKSSGKIALKKENDELIRACDLDRKIGARAKTLSGGQLRKLQLSMMFTGGSRVCCVDECSSGVDALARRRLIDILLAERKRSNRTLIFTTHFLDEADLLSDYIAILSKGNLKAEGTAPAIKASLGNGYRVHLYHTPDGPAAPFFEGIAREVMYDQTIYTVADSAQASAFIIKLEEKGFNEYQVNGPTIEDAFMKVSEEMVGTHKIQPALTESKEVPVAIEARLSDEKSSEPEIVDKGLQLMNGNEIGPFRQGWVLFRKRSTVLQRNWMPFAAAFLIPVIAAGLVTLFLNGFHSPGCSPTSAISVSDISSLAYLVDYDIVLGPSSRISPADLARVATVLPGAGSTSGGGSILNASALHMVDTLDDFNQYINQNYQNVTPGGIFLGDGTSPTTFVYQGDGDISLATITQNVLDVLLTNVSISSQFQAFDIPWAPGIGNSLQLVVYFGLAMSAAPAFFALYPTVERLRNVRALHYSNGVRALPLWLAYVSFDFIISLASSVIAIVIFSAASKTFYHPEYLFVCFFLYGLTSTLVAYVVSLVARSQLAAFAFTAGGLAVSLLLYFIAWLSTLTYAPTDKVDSYVNIVHFCVSIVFPTGSLVRSLAVSLNIFSLLCRDRSIASYPGEITLYGGPILYLILQSLFLFGILLWYDSGFQISTVLRGRKVGKGSPSQQVDTEEILSCTDSDISAEIARVTSPLASKTDGLRVLHLTKKFGSNVAIADISFGVKRGETFALLGPNGAGKSTTISLIRGDIRPSPNLDRTGKGEVFIENIPLSRRRATARQHLGVCPQFDAMDQMTVLEHLRFYARIRGVVNVDHNVKEVLRAVGLSAFSTRMAAKLSGGNKRKLSLGIALMGNPSVLLLDEPSSGMDVAAKRLMWRTLASIVPGRSLVLTTHSMEEADALANRAGIMAIRMLALGTSDYLRRRHGDRYWVHLLLASAPHTTPEESENVKSWIGQTFEGVEIESRDLHGQIRFSIPTRSVEGSGAGAGDVVSDEKDRMGADIDEISDHPHNMNDKPTTSPTIPGKGGSGSSIATLFSTLEAHKSQLGFEYYSVSQTTLDQVFLAIVGKHDVEEEGYRAEKKTKAKWRIGGKKTE